MLEGLTRGAGGAVWDNATNNNGGGGDATVKDEGLLLRITAQADGEMRKYHAGLRRSSSRGKPSHPRRSRLRTTRRGSW